MKNFFIILLIAFTQTANSATSGSNRNAHKVGAILGFNGEPTPSSISMNLAYHPFDFIRLQGGIGGANTFFSNVPEALYNATLANVFYVFAKIFNFSKRKPTIEEYRLKYDSITSSFAGGGGFKLLIPAMSFSPFVGGSFSYIETRGKIFGISGTTSLISGTAGLDLVTSGGFNLALGMAYAPRLGDKNKNQIFLNLGLFF